ncbi:MAG: UDP-N-acetylmuramoyl-tripeptide--D-alanyl-D-alanine ligase [Polyangia bacterium]
MKPARRPITFAVRAMHGSVLQVGAGDGTFAGAAADSRAVQPGQLFFALPGERVDGFAYAAQAAAAGAAAVVVARDRGLPAAVPAAAIIAVDDPRAALGQLARAVRAEFRGLVVGVTGSNGKTTTKELCAAALSPLGRILRTPGNFNTDVGLPLTILSGAGDEAVWILEMAMRARGEIAALAAIAEPAIGIITNVAAAHLETLGSIEEVARAKGELFASLGPNGIAVLPFGDPLVAAQAAPVAPSRRITFGDRGADVRVLDFIPNGATGAVVRFAVRGTPVVARLPLGGAHNARNAAAALAAACTAGVSAVDAARGLESVALPPHRSAARAAGGRTILDDCYNANPQSMRAALSALAAAAAGGRRFAILGDMLELGAGAEAAHRVLGHAAGLELSGVAAVGAFAQTVVDEARSAGLDPSRALAASSPEAAAAAVAGWTAPGDWILVKASRGLRLERAVEALQATLGGDQQTKA